LAGTAPCCDSAILRNIIEARVQRGARLTWQEAEGADGEAAGGGAWRTSLFWQPENLATLELNILLG
jgi:hypothetical protein